MDSQHGLVTSWVSLGKSLPSSHPQCYQMLKGDINSQALF